MDRREPLSAGDPSDRIESDQPGFQPGNSQSPVTGGPRLLSGRRRFLVGSVTVSTFAATFASRPALAGGTLDHGPISAVCSPTHSHGGYSKNYQGHHCDYWAQNKKIWSSDCDNTLSECGIKSSNYCDSSQTLIKAICGSETYSPCSAPNSQWGSSGGGQNSQGWGGSGGNSQEWGGSGGSSDWCGNWSQSSQWQSYKNGYYSFDTNASYNNSYNLTAWIACGWLNAKYNSGSFGYSCGQFVDACNNARDETSTCSTNIDSEICRQLSWICNDSRSTWPSHACGGPSSCWA